MNINWEELSKEQASCVVKDLLENNLTEKEEIKDLLASCVFMSSSVIMSDKIAIMKKILEVVSLKQDTDLLAEIIFGLDKQKAFSLFTTALMDSLVETDDFFVFEKFIQDHRFEYFKGRGSLLFLGLFTNNKEKRVFEVLNQCQEKTVRMMIPSLVVTLSHDLFFSPQDSEKIIEWFATHPLFQEDFFNEEKETPLPPNTTLSLFLQSHRLAFEEKKLLRQNLDIDNLKNHQASPKKM